MFKIFKKKKKKPKLPYDYDLISWEVTKVVQEVLDFIPPDDYEIFEPYMESIISRINKELARKHIPQIYHPGTASVPHLISLVEHAYDLTTYISTKQPVLTHLKTLSLKARPVMYSGLVMASGSCMLPPSWLTPSKPPPVPIPTPTSTPEDTFLSFLTEPDDAKPIQ